VINREQDYLKIIKKRKYEKYYGIISEKVISIDDSFQLGPYQFMWLKKE
jgi:hypothetical protein